MTLAQRHVVVDTCLLVLIVVGRTNKKYIRKHKKPVSNLYRRAFRCAAIPACEAVGDNEYAAYSY